MNIVTKIVFMAVIALGFYSANAAQEEALRHHRCL